MSHFARGLFTGVVAATVIGGVAFVSTQAEAAKMSKADKAALNEATATCKHEAKGKKIHWPASRTIRQRMRHRNSQESSQYQCHSNVHRPSQLARDASQGSHVGNA